METSYSIMY